ncbi:MAG: hypothetical protein PHH26_05000, partial [Candidatus Thermoplasmatota archaeon]|nr:hypothetical protein [Candidatus Thermoplasmatota archaeon]
SHRSETENPLFANAAETASMRFVLSAGFISYSHSGIFAILYICFRTAPFLFFYIVAPYRSLLPQKKKSLWRSKEKKDRFGEAEPIKRVILQNVMSK